MRTPRGTALLLAIVLGCTTFTAPVIAAQDTSPRRAGSTASAGAGAAAIALNAFYVPGKAITCATSAVLGTAALLLTFGNLWAETAHFVKGGCGGRWALGARDVHHAVSTRHAND